ncbi:hypothetical protein INT45_005464 [Circinella minor]|uniref:Uncharacterized protein n=1 Tax=Circinella minor TaxID=1195481 RepID=A0A8H7RZ29_9FUNG|nr:hypothetical protein INT45_005464 [Circinella minor]
MKDMSREIVEVSRSLVRRVHVKRYMINGHNPDAKNHYSPWPTEWPNRTISNVLYSPNHGNFPPILIEVQHMVDIDLVLGIVTYTIPFIVNISKFL